MPCGEKGGCRSLDRNHAARALPSYLWGSWSFLRDLGRNQKGKRNIDFSKKYWQAAWIWVPWKLPVCSLNLIRTWRCTILKAVASSKCQFLKLKITIALPSRDSLRIETSQKKQIVFTKALWYLENLGHKHMSVSSSPCTPGNISQSWCEKVRESRS